VRASPRRAQRRGAGWRGAARQPDRTTREQDEADEAQRAAHTLKSSGATFGAEDFSELCRELEARAKDGRLEGAEQLVDRIDGEYARVQEALAALRVLP
jgi:HPt (histidine-containing phosphotransfer) domain-containing protein